MRFAVGLLAIGLIAGTQSAQAGDCVPGGPAPKLNSEIVNWSIAVVSGQVCLRGLRSSTMILEGVTISVPAKVGEAKIQGYGFSYEAPRDFKGEDSFSVTVVGTNRGVRGNSTIVVNVSVQ